MVLTANDIEALRMLLREELVTREQFEDFQGETRSQLHLLSEQMDGIYKRFETLEQEYYSIREQVQRLEKSSIPSSN